VLTPTNPQLLFKGRPGDVRFGEWVETRFPDSTDSELISLFGCPDDQGIQINLGRPGARLGPDEIRRAFYKIAVPSGLGFEGLKLIDVGNIRIISSLAETHELAFDTSKELSQKTSCVILLGGGHDFAAPGFLGAQAGLDAAIPHSQWGLINIDPHLDVREFEAGRSHSGSSFRKIIDSGKLNPKHFVEFGCRKNRNTSAHFQFCEENGVTLIPLEDIHRSDQSAPKLFQQTLKRLEKQVDHLAVSLDMDSCCEITGTSALCTVGFQVRDLIEMAFQIGSNPSTRYFEIAEVSPPLDPSGKTALVAAEILYSFLCGRAQILRSRSNRVTNKKKNKVIKNSKKQSKR